MMDSPSALLTDAYQFTMFDSYVAQGIHEEEACFELFFRQAPDDAPFAVACGLESVLTFLSQFSFSNDQIQFLQTQNLISNQTAKILSNLRFSGNMLAVPEGVPVLPFEPILRITGPIGILHLVETPLLNLVNFQTLIATKASRVARTAAPAPVGEFGLRRAQGPEAAMLGVRAAFVGGVSSTSNVAAAYHYDIPLSGTMSHAYVMKFESELESFQSFADSMGNDTTLVVDTYDTLNSGVPNAIRIAKILHSRGQKLKGIRLDSGDLADLSIKARQMLDDAGLEKVMILVSNDLDEFRIADLRARGARIDAYGVGTRLITAFSQPALGGIYKLTAVKEGLSWVPKAKKTSESTKATLPGPKETIRLFTPNGLIQEDVLELSSSITNPPPTLQERDSTVNLKQKAFRLMHQVWAGETRCVESESLETIRDRHQMHLKTLPETALYLTNPQTLTLNLGDGLVAVCGQESFLGVDRCDPIGSE